MATRSLENPFGSNGFIAHNIVSPAPSKEVHPPLLRERGRRCLFITLAILLIVVVLAVALGVGLGVGLHTHNPADTTASTNCSTSEGLPGPSPCGSQLSHPGNNTANETSKGIWLPAAGTLWQIELANSLTNTSVDVPIYDIDLFENTAETISDLHAKTRKVICYFSAGSFEDWRPDAGKFNKTSDLGKGLDGWPGEWWLNTKSANVRNIMKARLDMAVQRRCDAVDPDNIDAYDNDNGLGLGQADAVDYVNFLADAAHARNLSIGLKNGGAILEQVVGKMQFSVNEQCVKYSECDKYQPFIMQGKPVFHIEYPKGSPDISADKVAQSCGGEGTSGGAIGFSSVLKNMNLDDWMVECPK